MELQGKIQETVIILIDCQATHNFIPEKLASLLNLPMVETLNYGVILGSSSTVKEKDICEGVELSSSDWRLKDSFFTSRIRGSGRDLGIQ